MSTLRQHHRTRTEYAPPTATLLSKLTHPSAIRVKTTPSQSTYNPITNRHIKSQSCFQQAHIVTVSTSKQTKTQRQAALHAQNEQYAKYILERIIAKGAFGVVYKAHSSKFHHLAVKKLIVKEDRKNRELELLKSIEHPNIIKMVDHYYAVQKMNQYLHIVTPLYSHSLRNIIQLKNINPQLFPLYLHQILQGLAYLNQKEIMHRDLTPSNILVQNKTHKVVIADFGSAKTNTYEHNSLSYLVSRPYRAPQLVFGSLNYSNQIDLWAFGCIAVQLVTGRCLFQAQSNIEHMLQIVKLLGTPTQQQMAEMNPDFSLREYESLPSIRKRALRDVVNSTNPQFINLLSQIFVYPPRKRITASQALNHPYFSCLSKRQFYDQHHLDPSDFGISLNQDEQLFIPPSSIKLQTTHRRLMSSVSKLSESTGWHSSIRKSSKVSNNGMDIVARKLF